MFAETPVGSKRFGWGPHPYRDQVQIRLAHFRSRARKPRMYQGGPGFPGGVTIWIGFGCSMGLAREKICCNMPYGVEAWRDELLRCFR
jgi:hypothetical protein